MHTHLGPGPASGGKTPGALAPRLKYPARAFLDCSADHLSSKTRAWLVDQMALPIVERDVFGGAMPDGWFVWVPEAGGPDADTDAAYPEDLEAVFRHARSEGCEYVLFDEHTSPGMIPGLQVFTDDKPEHTKTWRVRVDGSALDTVWAQVIVSAPDPESAKQVAIDLAIHGDCWNWDHDGVPENLEVLVEPEEIQSANRAEG